MKLVSLLTTALGMFLTSITAGFAAQPEPWQIWHQPAGSDIMARIEWFSLYTLWFIIPITIFVMILLAIVIVKFSAKNNPNPSRTSHNTLIEVVWTVAPIVILVAIAIPSFDLLDREMRPEREPEMTIKATGYQWYWGFEYQDGEEISFDSIMLKEGEGAEIGKGDLAEYPRLLAVDNELVVPVNTQVRVLVTAADVIHNFAMPAFGLKMDAIPGRLNETHFRADREGLYYGQCSELCGRDHAFMPIAIRVVSAEQFASWKAAAAGSLEDANKALMASVDADKNFKLANKN
ncbi:MAG: cytochrome c oxidase subunit II [Salaquimonas sp.]